MKRFLALTLLCLIAACDDGRDLGDDNTPQGYTDAELEQEIQTEAALLNYCDVVDDCESVSLNCSALFINEGAERTRLDDLLAEHQRREGDVGCPTVCLCGVLTCEGGKCVAEEAPSCEEPPAEGKIVCL